MDNCLKLLICLLALLLVPACASLPRDFERPVSFAYTDTADSFLGKKFAAELADHPGKSGFLLLGNGLDAFVARAVLAGAAERSIDVQYYLFHDDLVGRLFAWQLIKAAERGVRVRILLDDMGMDGRDLSLALMNSHPNIEIRLFNPFSRKTGRLLDLMTRMNSVTRRMHNKSFTVDSQATILGGRNIGNEYFEAIPDIAFADLDVLAVGPVVKDVAAGFDSYWNSELAYPINVLTSERPTVDQISDKWETFDQYLAAQDDSPYMQALKDSAIVTRLKTGEPLFSWGDAVLLFDRPEKVLRDYGHEDYMMVLELKPLLEDVVNELLIVSPYFVPGAQGTQLLAQLAEKGVRVRILTNSLASSDVSLVHAGYAKYREALLHAGVELFEMNKQFESGPGREKSKTMSSSSQVSLHAKTFVYDRKKLFIGSLNLDARSIVHNTEIGVVIVSEPLAGGMAQWFDENIDSTAFRLELSKTECGNERILWHGRVDGEMKTLDKDPFTGFWDRFFIGFLGLLPIESQL